MKLTIFLVDENGAETQIRQMENFSPTDKAHDIIGEAYDIAFKKVVFNYFHNGFGYSRHDLPSMEDGRMQSILRCSGRNVRYEFSKDGTMQKVADDSCPDRVFKIEITK